MCQPRALFANGSSRKNGNTAQLLKRAMDGAREAGANGVFSYGGNGGHNGGQGDGTTVVIEDTKITTTGDGSGGIMTTGGGVMKAANSWRAPS